MDLYIDIEAVERANVREAVILAKARYDETLARFVKNNPARLSYVDDQIVRLCQEIAEQRTAKLEEVEATLRRLIAEEMDVEKREWTKNTDEKPEPDAHTDIKDMEAVLEEGNAEHESLGEGHTYSISRVSEDTGLLDDESTWRSCFRCSAKLNPMVAQKSVVCEDCIQALSGSKPGMPPLAKRAIAPAAPQPIAPDPLQEMQATPPAPEEQAAELPPAARPDEQGSSGNAPADAFDDTVFDLGNIRAALVWSSPNENDINQIAEVYRLSPEEVSSALQVVAEFGDVVAVNGQVIQPQIDGLTKLPDLGGAVENYESEVDVESAVAGAAERTGITPQTIHDAIAEAYGDDMSGTYYLSISGNRDFYLPDELVAKDNQDLPNFADPRRVPQQPTDPPYNTGLASTKPIFYLVA